MKIYLINVVCGSGSTGRIVTDEYRRITADGGQCRIAYGRGSAPDGVDCVKISGTCGILLHVLLTRLFDLHGRCSKRATRRLIRDIKEFAPDEIHLHNIHGYYLHYPMLFAFLKEYGRPVVWTLHDCWSFTGHCAYFTMAGCTQWETACKNCPQPRSYPACLLKDRAFDNFMQKKEAFTGVERMELIVPSAWLKGLVEKSFLGEYPIHVRYNTIDKSCFYPRPGDYREKHGLTGKKVVLAAANIWDERKGLKDILALSRMLDESYAVVVAGLSAKQIRKLSGHREASGTPDACKRTADAGAFQQKQNGVVIPKGVENIYYAVTGENPQTSPAGAGCRLMLLPNTRNAAELAELYSMADFFVNPTYEDNYPTVNLEAQACGTYVITYDTGGCGETLL